MRQKTAEEIEIAHEIYRKRRSIIDFNKRTITETEIDYIKQMFLVDLDDAIKKKKIKCKERDMEIFNLRTSKNKITYKKIGEKYGISSARAAEIMKIITRKIRHSGGYCKYVEMFT